MNFSNNEETSIFGLGCILSESFTRSIRRDNNNFQDFVNLSDLDRKRRKLLRRNKQIFFDILLKKKNLAHISRYEMPLQDRVSAAAFEQTSTKKTQELFQLYEKLPASEDVYKVLEFLLNLQNSATAPTSAELTSIGDSISDYGSRTGFYQDFPRTIFNVNLLDESRSSASYRSFSYRAFQLDLSYSGLFPLKPRLGVETQEAAVSEAKDEGVSDEGYNSPSPDWEAEDLLTALPCVRSSWESQGRRTSQLEKCYLSEAGSEAVHHVWRLVVERFSLLDPSSSSTPRLTVVSTQDLTRHLGYLVAAIPSSSFHFNDIGEFFIRPGLTLRGLSPECLEAFVGEFLKTGNLTRKLEVFSSDSAYMGKTVEGLRLCVRSYLRVFTNAVIAISKSCSDNLGQFSSSLSPLISQVNFLAWVSEVLPAGVSLLSRLLDVSVHISDRRISFLLLSLLSSCSTPYLRFLKNWLFSGELEEGDNREFGIEIDQRFSHARDVTHWTSTYRLIPLEGSNFLADIQSKVHLTGKSVALLKLICPEHHLCGKYRDLQPAIKLAVSTEDQVRLTESFREYESQLTAIANECTDTYWQKKAREDEERIKRMELIRLNIQKSKARQEKEELKRREEKVRKQQQLYSDLQDQMAAVNERKLREKKEREELEKQIQAEADAIEAAQTKREEEEKRALEEFYANLNAEAEARQKRSDWRVRRSDPVLKNKRLAIHNTPVVYSPLPESPADDSTLNSKVLFDFDEMGNVSVMVEDHEGNIVTEVIEGLKELDEDTKDLLKVDNFDSLVLPEKTRTLIEKSLTRITPSRPNSRADNKAHVLGSNIHFQYEESDPPIISSRALVEVGSDLVDGMSRRKVSQSQQIERLLYPQRFQDRAEVRRKTSRTDFHLCQQDKPLQYRNHFSFSGQSSLQEMGGLSPVQPPADCQASAPLSLILHNSILVPLRAQSRLVNSALLNHMLVDRRLANHFEALRKYLMLADGEFGRQLVVSLCQLGQTMASPGQLADQLHSHLLTGAPPPHLLSPTTLNRVLDSAINGSVSAGADPLSRHLTFLLDQPDSTRNLGIPGLSLTYQAAWPENIVLSLDTVAKYSNILNFQLELRLALLSLELDWAGENLVLRGDRKSQRRLLHKVSLMRHEMLNFLRNLRDYVASQILEISWLEFQDNLHKVTCLDELITVHEKYLDRALFRCLLNSKAAPVMKIVRNIISSITKFSGIISTRMSGDLAEKWGKIEKQHYVFREYSGYLFKLVTKLNARGYQPHLQDLILRLNFNEYYDKN